MAQSPASSRFAGVLYSAVACRYRWIPGDSGGFRTTGGGGGPKPMRGQGSPGPAMARGGLEPPTPRFSESAGFLWGRAWPLSCVVWTTAKNHRGGRTTLTKVPLAVRLRVGSLSRRQSSIVISTLPSGSMSHANSKAKEFGSSVVHDRHGYLLHGLDGSPLVQTHREHGCKPPSRV